MKWPMSDSLLKYPACAKFEEQNHFDPFKQTAQSLSERTGGIMSKVYSEVASFIGWICITFGFTFAMTGISSLLVAVILIGIGIGVICVSHAERRAQAMRDAQIAEIKRAETRYAQLDKKFSSLEEIVKQLTEQISTVIANKN